MGCAKENLAGGERYSQMLSMIQGVKGQVMGGTNSTPQQFLSTLSILSYVEEESLVTDLLRSSNKQSFI